MDSLARNNANRNHRNRLEKRGIKRFEVLASEVDRELIKSLSRRLLENGPDSDAVRSVVRHAVGEHSSNVGGILAALRASPLVGADLDLSRNFEPGRDVVL